jgi:hypothetical protein
MPPQKPSNLLPLPFGERAGVRGSSKRCRPWSPAPNPHPEGERANARSTYGTKNLTRR